MDGCGYIHGGAAFQEGLEAGDKHRDILGDYRFIACDFGGGECRPDDFASMLAVAGVSAGAEDILNHAVITAEVIEIAFLDAFVEAIDSIEVC
jgi:hypothetical protein